MSAATALGLAFLGRGKLKYNLKLRLTNHEPEELDSGPAWVYVL
jgi:hypothetical protein